MSWKSATRRWRKMHRGVMYTVSCRQLGVAETKEASWRAANEWWGAKLAELSGPSPGERAARAARVAAFVRDFPALAEDERRAVFDALRAAGSYDAISAAVDATLAGGKAPDPERLAAAQAEAWKGLLRSSCRSGQMSAGRLDAYRRRIAPFVESLGPGAPVDAIDEAAVELYYGQLSSWVASGRYSPATAHEMLMTARQFVRWLAERKLIAPPGNLDSRRFRFNHSAAREVEVYDAAEARELLARAPSRMRLYLLLMLNCGMYQHDIAELRSGEVDWAAGTITRRRSKTRERGGPIATYPLWPETFALLAAHRAPGELALVSEAGTPLVSYAERDGKHARSDAIRAAWVRMGGGRLPLKHLRKTSATLLGSHPQYKFYANHFLADSPTNVADRHYVVPNGAEFAAALAWLRGQILGDGAQGDQPAAGTLLDEQEEEQPV